MPKEPLSVTDMGMSDFAKVLAEQIGTRHEHLNPRDIAKAIIAVSNNLSYTPKTKHWYRWNGLAYESYDIGIRNELIADAVEAARNACRFAATSLDSESKGMLNTLLKREYAFSGAQFPRDLEALLRDMCQVDDELFDADSSVLVCESGVLDREAAKHGEIIWLPHDPERLTTQYIPLRYDSSAECPEWEAFLASSTRDVRRLQVMLGFALAGDSSHKKRIVNLVGPTDTGKSTVLDLLSSIIGCYLGLMRTDELTVSRHNAKFDFHGLRNSRAVFCSEPEQNSRFRIADLKRLTGGEEIVTEGKGQAPIRWRSSVMPFIGTNYHIHFDTTDEAFERRLEFIEFERTREIDYQLRKRLYDERHGIFSWILDGILAYFSGELKETLESEAARRRAEAAVEGPLKWLDWAIDEGKIVDCERTLPPSRYVSVGLAYENYKQYCIDEGTKPYGRQRFSKIIQKRYSTDKSSGRHRFVGLAQRSS